MSWEIREGDALARLREMPDCSVHCVVTSPPYWGLRDYGVAGQLGLERTPEEYTSALVGVFAEVRRVLREDGTLWLNLGDSYAGSWGAQSRGAYLPLTETSARLSMLSAQQIKAHPKGQTHTGSLSRTPGLKAKDLCMIPARVAMALQADGWWLRAEIVWHKPAPMPESVTDRPTRAHEMVYLLTRAERYHYDAAAIAEPATHAGQVVRTNGNEGMDEGYDGNRTRDGFRRGVTVGDTRNKRTVWTIAPSPFPEAHFATFPPELPELCIKAGCPEGGTVLDSFAGAGTTGLVATRLGRDFIGIELNPTYAALARKRIDSDCPLFNRTDGAA